MKSLMNYTLALMLTVTLAGAPLGCESLPGDEKSQGAVIGGVGGAAAGAAVGGEDNRLGGALIGGLLGAGGGYLIGREMEKDDEDEARVANTRAAEQPATVNDALAGTTADLNNDGFVTLDEVVAMEEAGLSDAQQIRRLQLTNQIFSLTPSQQDYLRDRGVSNSVILAMESMNRNAATTNRGGEVVGSETVNY